MSAPADHIPSRRDARMQTSTSSSKRTSSMTARRSRMRSASYVFAFGLLSQATATRSFFSREMYVRSIASPRAVLSERAVIKDDESGAARRAARGSGLLEDRDVLVRRAARPDHVREFPARLVGDPREVVGGDPEEVEPVPHATAVPDPEGDPPRADPTARGGAAGGGGGVGRAEAPPFPLQVGGGPAGAAPPAEGRPADLL